MTPGKHHLHHMSKIDITTNEIMRHRVLPRMVHSERHNLTVLSSPKCINHMEMLVKSKLRVF